MLASMFDMSNTKSIVQKDIYPDSGETPYVTASSENNGIMTYISCPDAWIDKGNCILIGGKTLTFTYQNADFCSNDSHNIALYLKDEKNATRLHYLFLLSALRASLSRRYSWGDSISMKRIKDEHFYIPVDSHGCPDWTYIDSFMAKVMKESEACLENLRIADEKKTPVEISQWKEFQIGELFKIVKGTRLTKANMREGNNRFIGSSAMNNGLTTLIANDEKLHPANTLTVCYNGSVGETFYQDEPFWASDDVNVLYPKFSMTKNVGLFIAPLIRFVGQRYAFVDKWRMDVMEKDCIKLPVDSCGCPNWAYMDEYMSAVLSKAEDSLMHLRQVMTKGPSI